MTGIATMLVGMNDDEAAKLYGVLNRVVNGELAINKQTETVLRQMISDYNNMMSKRITLK